jgi:hypothetical protein
MMSDLLSRLIQLRYEYFNQLSFEDLDYIIASLNESDDYESDYLINIMQAHATAIAE